METLKTFLITKTNEFMEKFQTAFDPHHPVPQSGPFLWKLCAGISYYLASLQRNFPKMRGGQRPFGSMFRNGII